MPWKQLFSAGIYGKNSMLFVVVPILLFITFFSYFVFLKEAFFDTSRRPVADVTSIEKIEVREGYWKWNDIEWAHGHAAKLSILDKKELDSFCTTLISSQAKYIDNIRPIHWLNIYFTKDGEDKLSVVLKDNYQGEIFIEYENHTYDGRPTADLLNYYHQTRRDDVSK